MSTRIISKFYLPFPPSVNSAYKNVGRCRSKTKRVRDWEKMASSVLNAQNIRTVRERIILIYALIAPDKRPRDEQNYAKVATDFLVAKGILLGDEKRYIQSTVTLWRPGVEPGVNVFFTQEDENLLEKLLGEM